MALKVFVGSSVEGLAVAYAVQQNLEHKAEVTVWDQGIFHLSKSALDSLIQGLEHFDFGIFVFNPEDIVTMRGNQNRTVRDNVVFELGLFIGRLGKERSFILMPHGQTDVHLPTDLIGMTPGTYQPDRSDGSLQAATGASCHAIYQAMNVLGPLSTFNDRPQAPQSSELSVKSKITEQEEARAEDAERGQKPTEEEPDWLNLFFSDKYDDVIVLLEKKIENSTDDDDNRYYRIWIGRAKSKLDLKSGVEYLTQLKDENSDWHAPYLAIADAYHENGFRDEALAILDAGLAAAKKGEWLQYTKAGVLYAEGDTDEALHILHDLIEKSPQFESGYLKAAEILAERDKKDEAIKMYESGLKLLPTQRDLLYGYGQLLAETGDNDAALTVFKRLNELDPKNTAYLTYLGNSYLNLGLNGLAMEAYQKANEIAEGKERWIIANIGNLFNNQGFHPLAMEHLKRAIALNADSAYAHERLASAIKLDQEERKRADEIIRKHKETKKQRILDSEQVSTVDTSVKGSAA